MTGFDDGGVRAAANRKGRGAEQGVHDALAEYCAAHQIKHSRKSTDYAEFFGPKNGFQTDGKFTSRNTGISVELEVKYQVSGGNTWERNGRFWFPGVRAALNKNCKVADGVFPLWCVFCGPMVTSRKYQEKILGAYKNFLPNVALIRDPQDESEKVLRHFVMYIVPILAGEYPPKVSRADDPMYYHFESYREERYRANI